MFSRLPRDAALEKEDRTDEMKKIKNETLTRPLPAASTAGPCTYPNKLTYKNFPHMGVMLNFLYFFSIV